MGGSYREQWRLSLSPRYTHRYEHMLMNLYTYVHSYKEKWYKEGLPERHDATVFSLHYKLPPSSLLRSQEIAPSPHNKFFTCLATT